jgi:hypothetical protein
VQPEYLLGRRVTVKWDIGWFAGKVTAFDETSFKHKVGIKQMPEVPSLAQLQTQHSLCAMQLHGSQQQPPLRLHQQDMQQLSLPALLLLLQVEYDDGDTEELLVGLGVPIKVCIAAGEQLPLPLPSSEQLTELSQVLLQLAEQADAEAAKPGGPAKRRQHQKEGATCMHCA